MRNALCLLLLGSLVTPLLSIYKACKFQPIIASLCEISQVHHLNRSCQMEWSRWRDGVATITHYTSMAEFIICSNLNESIWGTMETVFISSWTTALFGGILPSWVRTYIGVGSGICASCKKSSGTLASPVRSWNVNSYKVSAFPSPNVRPQNTDVPASAQYLYMYACMYEFYTWLINRQTLNILFNHVAINTDFWLIISPQVSIKRFLNEI